MSGRTIPYDDNSIKNIKCYLTATLSYFPGLRRAGLINNAKEAKITFKNLLCSYMLQLCPNLLFPVLCL